MQTRPVERVRARVCTEAGEAVGRSIPRGYQRIGHVVVLRLPESIRPHFATIGEAWLKERGITTVVQRGASIQGDWRLPPTELIGGDRGDAEVVEFGVRYRLDPSCLLFARGNRTERHRAGLVTRPGETVVDLFAGIGYFAVPSAKIGRARRVYACEANPVACRYLEENARINGVESVVCVIPGDNRQARLTEGIADRVFLGLLPTSVPWISQALRLLRPEGGTLHVHLVAGTRDGNSPAESAVARAVEADHGRIDSMEVREVKAYGPGRRHIVVDVRARLSSNCYAATAAA
jgi:tRNA wybutosine-synthesizing protein 2